MTERRRGEGMPAHLHSVNVSLPRDVVYRGKTIRTGIFKTPVPHRVRVRTSGLDGDGQADRENHGGAHKAVYAYPMEHYAYWERTLARAPFGHGQFGENLTVSGLEEESVCVGDVFRVGSTLLQVSQPRTPCYKLAMKMEQADFPKQFLSSRRTGFYLRVLEEGDLAAGDGIERVREDPERLSIREVTSLRHFRRDDLEGARRALTVTALSPTWRDAIGARLR